MGKCQAILFLYVRNTCESGSIDGLRFSKLFTYFGKIINSSLYAIVHEPRLINCHLSKKADFESDSISVLPDYFFLTRPIV